jgi:hypothetical protein
MKRRCLNPNQHDWKYYGGRGVKVCERWMTFDNFLADMGECPPDGSIDRMNNDGDYEPTNCRWIPQVEQSRTNRQKILVEIDGISMPMRGWAQQIGVSPSCISRLRRVYGWTAEQAVRYYLPV